MNKAGEVTPSVAAMPMPVPDRVAQLVAAARSVQGKTYGANLSSMMRR